MTRDAVGRRAIAGCASPPSPALAMRRRVVRLAAVSAVALGIVWRLALDRTGAPVVATSALLAGWLLMPTLLIASLLRPGASRLLALPSLLVTLPVAAIVAAPWAPGGITRAAWAAIAAGLLLGGLLGLWLWLGAFPVPSPLRDPRTPLRWALIVVHVAPIVVGLALVAAT